VTGLPSSSAADKFALSTGSIEELFNKTSQ